jgi:mannose-6-phosphate isomerase class I
MTVPRTGTLWALTAVGGQGTLEVHGEQSTIRRGQSVVVPAAAGELTVTGRDLEILATYSPTTRPE